MAVEEIYGTIIDEAEGGDERKRGGALYGPCVLLGDGEQ
jgi:hypothetical protein